MKVTLQLTDEQIQVIMLEELENAIGDIELSTNFFSSDWQEDLKAFQRVLNFYKG